MSSSSIFFSRGSISPPNTRFHMVGVIESGTEISVLPGFLNGLPNTAGKTTKDIYFLLCENNYKDSKGDKKQRVYWSSDPTDFVINYNSNSQNQGPIQLQFFNKNGSNDYKVKFFTSEKSSTHTYQPSFSNELTNNPSDIQLENNSGIQFSVTEKDQNLNINKNQVYLSVEYDLVPYQANNSVTSDRQYPWCFRKIFGSQQTQNNLTIDSNSSYTSTPLFSYSSPTGNNNPLVPTNVPEISFGSTTFPVTHDTSKKQFSIPNANWSTTTNKPKFNLMVKKNGIIKFIENTSPTNFMIVKYSTLTYSSNQDIIFQYSTDSDINMYNTSNSTFITTSTVCKIEYEIRNDPFGFDSVPVKESTENNRFSSWFKIYFIPATSSAFFPGGYTLTRTEFYSLSNLVPSATFTIYNPNDGNNTTGGSIVSENTFQNIFYRYFSTFFVLNLLSGLPSYWTRSSESGYPNIAIDPVSNGNTKSTIFSWTTQSEASTNYMYPYCTNSEFCGNCMGVGQTTTTCVPHNNSTRNAALSSIGSRSDPVFISPDRQGALAKQIDNDENMALYVLFIIFGLLFLVIIGVMIGYGTKSGGNLESKKPEIATTTQSPKTQETKV